MKLSVAILFVFGAVLLLATESISAETCAPENCIESSQCESLNTGAICGNGGTCCSILKQEFRTHCGHHGGECMDSCNSILRRNAVDCPAGTTCCVLV